ncbi:MAG: hypothetical protein E7672_01240 [Ruminococcaceae bacterium]|nr:hypothetical protein [Oscillospiraceae bacterium]
MKKRAISITLYVLAVLLLIGLVYYVTLPPISIYSGEFWTFFFFIDILVLVSYYVIGVISGKIYAEIIHDPSGHIHVNTDKSGKKPLFTKVVLILSAAVIVFLVIGGILSSQMFRAKTYSSLITVDDAQFAEDIRETEYVSDIALMDTASARIIGARTLGTLSDLVSQYNVSNDYTQIAMRSAIDDTAKPYKVAPLEYASFFKWLTNQSSGIPGYVKVDTVRFDAEFVRLEGSFIKYSPSAYLAKDLYRALRFEYPTAIFGSICFEVDDNGHPYWVASTMKPNAGLFGAMDVDTVITLDACTGETAEYKPSESPDWIDIVYYGTLICQKYDWYGMLRGGYLNSAFAQTNCVVTTDDFGYKIIGNDVYIFTGVTSTSNDEANIGFILANSRTGEYKFFSVPGAEEYSAMSAAEGSVQQYGYQASFPSLINVGGEATYIMVLKDASGIVKMYSMVNVRNYNIVVTSETQDDVFQKYKTALAQNGTKVDSATLVTEEIVIDEIIYITKSGETTVYIKSPGGVYGMAFTEDILFYEVGDTIKIAYTTKNDGSVTIISRIEE